MEENIKNIILLGENVNTELKEASNGLPKSIFQTVCSFLNTTGGYIILGANDKKEIVGIKKELIDKIKKDYTTMCNNKQINNRTYNYIRNKGNKNRRKNTFVCSYRRINRNS